MNGVYLIGRIEHILTKDEESISFLLETTSSEIIGTIDEEKVYKTVIHPCKATGRWIKSFENNSVQEQMVVGIEGRMINENGAYLVQVENLIIV